MKYEFKEILSNKLYEKIRKEKQEVESLIEEKNDSFYGKIYNKTTEEYSLESSIFAIFIFSVIIGILNAMSFSFLSGIISMVSLFFSPLIFLFLVENNKINAIRKLNISYSKKMKTKLILKENTQKIIKEINERTNKLSDIEKDYLEKLLKEEDIEKDFQLNLIKEKIKNSETEEIISFKNEIINYVEEKLDEKDSKKVLSLIKNKAEKEKEKKEKIKNSLNQAFSELEKVRTEEFDCEKINLKVQL